MVAEVFGKRHDHVMRDIENLECSSDFRLPNFGESTFVNEQGRRFRKYLLSKDGLMFLVMGYRGAKAAEMKERYIAEFNRMEQFIKEQIKMSSYMIKNPIERATRWIEEEKERMLLEDKLTEQAPKVEFHDKVLRSKELLTVTTIAKDFGMSAIEFNRLLRLHGIQYRQGNKWHLYDRYADKGYVDYVTYEQGNTLMRWTQAGRLFLYEFLKEQKILPAC